MLLRSRRQSFTTAVNSTSRASTNSINGPAGFSAGSDSEQLRNDFVNHFVNPADDSPPAQFDGFQIVGNTAILNGLLGLQVTLCNHLPQGLPSGAYRDWVLVCSLPFQVWVNPQFSDPLIQFISAKKNVIGIRSGSPRLLFKEPITLAANEMIEALTTINVDQVRVVSYGQKASMKWGIDVMKLCRDADPECKIKFDVAVAIPSTKAHWIRQDHSVPAEGDPFFTLASMPCDRDELQERFGAGTKAFHFPIFMIQQLLWNAGTPDFLPCFGGVSLVNNNGGSLGVHGNILKFKGYNTVRHQHQMISSSSFEAHKYALVSTANTRLDSILKYANELFTCPTHFRVEATCSLPDASVISNNQLLQWEESLSYVWDGIIDFWSRLSFIHIPSSYLRKTSAVVTDYATHKESVPKQAWAFIGRKETKLNDTRRLFASMVFNCFGYATETSNKEFYNNFANVGDKKNATLEWLAVEILRYHAKGNREKLDELLQTPPKSVLRRAHANMPVQQQHSQPHPLTDGNTIQTHKNNPVTHCSEKMTLAPHLQALYDIILSDACSNPYRCKLSLIGLDDYFGEDAELTLADRTLLDQISECPLLFEIHRSVDIREATNCSGERDFRAYKKQVRVGGTSLFLRDKNPLQLILRIGEEIQKRKGWKEKEKWKEMLVLKQSVQAASGRVEAEEDVASAEQQQQNSYQPRTTRSSARQRTRSAAQVSTTSTDDADMTIQAQPTKKSKFEGMRVGKLFHNEDDGEEEAFFGKVIKFHRILNLETNRYQYLYRVRYDDGDREDMSLRELKAAIQFYEEYNGGEESD